MIKKKSPEFKKPFSRTFLKIFGKTVVPLFFDFEKVDQENVPGDGPLIVVGNHEGALEAVLMGTYVPRNVEMLAGDEFPQETIVNIAKSLYGVIPVKRMFMDKEALEQALGLLENGGAIGVFPEGGVWNAGNMEPKLGAAWLSYYSRAPVLPIAFSGSKGAWHAAIRGKRPSLSMKFGEIIPPVEKVPEANKKEELKKYSKHIWREIENLIPDETELITDIKYDLYIYIEDQNHKQIEIPDKLQLQNKYYLGQLLHNPGVIKLFNNNLKLPVEVLKELDEFHPADKFYKACQAILEYLDQENPYMLLYRFGIEPGKAMKNGIQELKNLTNWAKKQNFLMKLVAVYQYYLPEKHQKVIKTKQDEFGKWI